MTRPHKTVDVDDETMEELEQAVEELHDLSHELGLTPPPVNYWLVDHDEINQLAAYEGFQTRYPHWRWGMNYVRRRKQDTYFGGKIFELVNHDTPANAFNQVSNNLEDQKSVIAHVEAHADFFANNQYFEDEPNASGMLERHAQIIESYYDDPSINREDVEAWIDAILCIQDTIDPLRGMHNVDKEEEDVSPPSIRDKLDSLDVSDEVKRHVLEDVEDEEESGEEVESDSDVLAFLLRHGKQFNEDRGRAEEYEDWQRAILEMLRREAYYFSAQRMTKIMNEGWAAFWESIMMGNEAYAKPDEIIEYADKQSRVLASQGLNPYKIGKEMWEYIENRENRREVIDKLLRIDGITWRNFHDKINFTETLNILEENRDDDTPSERHYSLLRRQNLGFIQNISQDELQQESRYMFEDDVYSNIEEALADVDYEAGWERMREIRETHNDITFIDSFLTSEFVTDAQYFAYEWNPNAEEMQVSGTDLDAVKKKLLLQIANGGKPTIIAADNNYHNAGELLLKHQYNGVQLDIGQAREVLKRVFDLWGHTVNLKTIVKDEDGNEQGKILVFDGETISERDIDTIDDIKADQIDYDTKPDEWL